MAYQALYRKWRPLIFSDVIGQAHISDTLKNSLINNKTTHAYLFCGTRGTGKTTMAKIFARALNCTSPQEGNPCGQCEACLGILDGSVIDVYEMDAASNNGVNDIRSIRDEVAYAPAKVKYKIYIIDEVHMLSTEAFNALLKTLEEPPAHVIFILATTEPHKIPATILSRCQRFDFKRIKSTDIAARIKHITSAEKIKITDEAIELLSELADGSMRDGLSILEQCVSYGAKKLTLDNVLEIAGVIDRGQLFDAADCIIDGDVTGVFEIITKACNQGKEILSLFEDLILHFRNLLICKSANNVTEILDKSDSVIKKYEEQAQKYSREMLLSIITTLAEQMQNAKWTSQPQVAMSVAIVKMSDVATPRTKEHTPVKPEAREAATAFPPPKSEPAALAANKKADTPMPINEPAWSGWRKALDLIKEESKQLFTYLYSAKVLRSGEEITVVLKNQTAYERVGKPEGIKYLEKLFSGVHGSPCTVTVVLEGKEDTPNNALKEDNNLLQGIVNFKDKFGDKMTIE